MCVCVRERERERETEREGERKRERERECARFLFLLVRSHPQSPSLQYELLFCLAEADASPSLPLVTQLMNTYPSVEARVFQGQHSSH